MQTDAPPNATGCCQPHPAHAHDSATADHACSSLVHTLETKSPLEEGVDLDLVLWGNPEFDLQSATREETIFRHSGWLPRRQKVWDAMIRTHQSQNKLAAFRECGASLWLEAANDGSDIRLRCNQCHNRFCIPCATSRAMALNVNLAKVLADKQTRFMTLTLRHSNTPLKDQIDRLYRSFATFRRRHDFQEHVRGGAAFLEIKLSERDGLWHVHLHCIIEGKWWDQREVSAGWHAVTGDSSIVDIRPVKSGEDAARYVTKYVTKPADSSVFAVPDKLDEFMTAIKGRRLCLTFGSWRGIKLEEKPEPTSEGWNAIGSVGSLYINAKAGDENARRWLEAAHRKWPILLERCGTIPAVAPDDAFL